MLSTNYRLKYTCKCCVQAGCGVEWAALWLSRRDNC